MEQKIKIVFIGLIAICALSFIFNIFTLVSKQRITREKNALEQENVTLNKKIEATLQQNKELQNGVNLLKQNLTKLAKERETLQKKYAMVENARAELVNQVQALSAQIKESPGGVPAGVSMAEDEYWAAILKENKENQWKLDELQSKLSEAKINNEDLQRQRDSLELEITNLSRDKQELSRQYEFFQKQVEYNKKMMETISLELVGEKNDKMKIEESLDTIKRENNILRRQLESVNSRKINLERKISELEDSNRTLESRFSEMDIMLEDKVLEVSRMNRRARTDAIMKEEPVELSPIIVRPAEMTSQFGTTIEGRVVALNRENNFVIVDLGQVNSVRVGDVLGVLDDGNRPIATLEVIETRDSISACDILRTSTPLQVGNLVRVK